jgi:hypothetical protein
MKPSGSVSTVSARTDDPAQESLRKRPSLFVAPIDKPDDLELARQLVQETKFANSLSDKKSPVSGTPTKGIKAGRPPDFDDDAIQWVGRVI